MDEMSGDEMLALGAGVLLAVLALMGWYRALMVSPGKAVAARGVLVALPWVCLGGLFGVLRMWAAHDVKDDGGYLFLFMAAGMASLGGVNVLAWAMGYGVRDDVLERGNAGAAWVVGGAMVGGICCFAGANIGEGPTIWTTLGPAGLALLTWGAVWVMVELLAGISTAVTVERDGASGVRLAAMLMANGLVMGRAMAGNFVSWEATVRDFVMAGWPVVVVGAVAVVWQIYRRPTVREPRRNVMRAGVMPGAVMLALALGWMVYLGRW